MKTVALALSVAVVLCVSQVSRAAEYDPVTGLLLLDAVDADGQYINAVLQSKDEGPMALGKRFVLEQAMVIHAESADAGWDPSTNQVVVPVVMEGLIVSHNITLLRTGGETWTVVKLISETLPGDDENTKVVFMRGRQGDTGATGSQGPTGFRGSMGKTGPQGEKGDTGLQGPAGANAPDRTEELCKLYVLTGYPQPTYCPPPPPKYSVFVTSQTYDGNLGGVAGADAKCNAAAVAGGLSGQFLAWIASNATDTPAERFTHYAEPVYRTDGVKIADDWNDLTDGDLDAPITRDESGNAAPYSAVFTNVSSDGSLTIAEAEWNCHGWTYDDPGETYSSLYYPGINTAIDYHWTFHEDWSVCFAQYRLYCFQQ